MKTKRTYQELENRVNDLESKLEESKNIKYKLEMTNQNQVEGGLMNPYSWLENSPVCTKIVDLDFNLQYMSNSGVKELKIDDITKYYGQPYPLNFYPDSFKIPMTGNLKKVKETGEIIVQEASIINTNGEIIWYHSTLIPVNDDNGQLDYIMIVSLETTEQKSAEDRLMQTNEELKKTKEKAEENEEKYKLLFDRETDAIFIYHPETTEIIEANEATSTLYGYSRNELIGMSVLKFSDEVKQSVAQIEKIRKEGKTEVTHRLHKKKDGTLFYVDIKGYSISLKNEDVMFAVSKDIDRRVKSEQELIKAKEKTVEQKKKLQERVKELNCLYEISKIVESQALSLDDIFERIVNVMAQSWQFPEILNARIVIGKKEYKTLGFEESKCKLIEDIFVINTKEGFVEVNYSKNETNNNHAVFLQEEKKLLHAIAERIGKIKERKKLEETLKSLLESQEVIIKLRTDDLRKTNKALDNEISERIHKEKILLKQKQELRALNDTKDKLFSIIAHDLRSPFNGILGFSELLVNNRENLKAVDSEKYIGFINTTAKNTLILLDNLLNWAKAQTGQLIYKPEKTGILPIIQEIITISNSSASVKNITLNYNISKDIEVFADKNMLLVVLRNLISNAIKFTRVGGEINVSVKPEHNQVEITISDNGVGMKEEIREKLFKIATNNSSRGTANEKGSGLGLILCKEFVEKHGGTIWVESEEGKGSDFKFTLPLN